MKATTQKTGNQQIKKRRLGKVLYRHRKLILWMLILCFLVFGSGADIALAASDPPAGGGSSADSLWTTVSDLIGTWVTRLGGVVMFVGLIMFGLGWKSDDAEQKSRGISTIIAGAIVTAAAALVGTFFG